MKTTLSEDTSDTVQEITKLEDLNLSALKEFVAYFENIIAKADRAMMEEEYGFTVNIYANGENPDEAWDKAQAQVAEYGLPKWTDYRRTEIKNDK